MKKYDALKEIFELEGIDKKVPMGSITIEFLLGIFSKDSYSLSEETGLSPRQVSVLLSKLFPDRPKTNIKVCTYLLSKYGMKYCSACREVYFIEEFSKNAAKSTGYNTHCKRCYTENTRDYQREYQKTRRELKANRVPSWANLEAIKEIYNNCPDGYHVDHIVPLRGDLVSGLHVENNLQYLLAEENIKKSNKFSVGDSPSW